MFAIDFTKPYLYKDVVYFHQGNLSTNNTLRCTLNTGGSNDLTGCNIICTFKLQNSTEISGAGRIIDPLNAIVDLVFPSNALVVGLNKLEILVNRSDGSVAQSPSITYDIWKGLTTGNGIEVETNYPILIQLINSANEASNKANSALNKANSMITDMTDAIDNAYRSANEADIATSNANTKIEEVETAKIEMIKKVDTSIETMKLSVEDAKNEMALKADEKIADVDRALAAGTVDLELKEARKDASGVVHDTVKQRLDSDLIIGDKSVKDFVIDMNGMKESQDLAYDTNKSYQVCTNTQVGLVKDLKVYGETMINICNNDYTKSNIGIYYHAINKSMFPFGEDVTIKVFKENDSSLQYLKWALYGVDSEGVARVIKGYTNDFSQVTLNVKDTYPSYRLYLQSHDGNNYVDFDRNKVKVCIVKGNVNIVDFFEGLASVGNGRPLEVNTLKWSGNLFDDKVLKLYIKNENDTEYELDYGQIWYNREKLVYLTFKVNTSYKFSCTQKCSNSTSKPRFYFHYTDGTEDHVTIGNTEWETVTAISRPNKTLEYISATYGNSGGIWTVKKDSICLYEDTTKYKFEPYLEDKKPILYKDANGAWKPVTELNEWDVLDTVNNKLELNSLRTVLNNKDKLWRDNGTDKGGFKTYWKSYDNFIIDKCICNKLKVYDVAVVREEKCIFFNKTKGLLYITIPQSECASLIDLDTWFSNNNIEIVIPSPKSEYELNPIYPDSFEGDTMVMVKGGALPIKASWKITSNLPNFVKELSKQVRQLQDQVYKTNVANFTVALNTLDTKLRLDRLEAPQM
ncbi:MAG: hypothetical protein ACRDDE_05655 [Paraclostridium sp.]|uniref:hypothetical protein n=1 Tax=Paraclostridium sp. TaxID=2023273 RepID=UPI003EE62B07